MSRYRKFTMIAAVAALAFGLAACGSSDNDTADSTPPVVTPTPDPVPTDLEATQTAAAAAAAAAMTASANAAASASSAADKTMTLATRQTGDDSNSDAMGGREAATAAGVAAEHAAAEAAKAAAASAAAAAAATGEAGEAAWRMAVAAQEAAEAAETMAADMAEAAIAAAMSELHIAGTVKTVGESSVDAGSGTLTSPDSKIFTGLQQPVSRTAAMSAGRPFTVGVDKDDPADDVSYIQAVAGGSVNIGKILDTSDDMARLKIITSYQGKKTVRPFVDGPAEDGLGDLLDKHVTDSGQPRADGVVAKSIGLFYKAEHFKKNNDGAEPKPDLTNTELGADDQVTVDGAKGVEIFELSDGTNTGYARVENVKIGDDGPEVYYQAVDIIANKSATDDGDADPDPEDLRPTVSIPTATEYSHIHFGLWTSLGGMSTAQTNANLGIGFVQNHDDSGMTERQGIGTASYKGDWVAAVRRQYASNAEAGAIELYNGSAALTADFEDGKFTGMLTGLATLEGTLANNGFSGMTAKAITHDDLDASGTFAGEFRGGIYGPTGSEAAGVFDFDGGESGAFRGAFGGAQ